MKLNKFKRIFRKRNIVKALNGSISILLCLLITPFASVALGMVEYARYQQVINLSEEVTEITAFSELSDYDTYLHDRFGLLATSQENELGSDTVSLLNENIKALGNQVQFSNTTVKGEHSIKELQVLEQQIVDVSELTASTAILAKDFKLEELLNKLNTMDQFNDVMNTVDSIADMADALASAIEALEKVKTAVNDLKTAIDTVKTNADSLATSMSNLYKKLGEDGVAVSSSSTTESLDESVEKFTSGDYLTDLKSVYRKCQTLITSLNDVKTKAGLIKPAIDDFVTEVNAAKTAAEAISTTNSADTDGSISQAAKRTLDDVLREMQTLVTNTLNNIKEETINGVKAAVNDVIDGVIEEVGLSGVIDRYSEIVSGSYFSAPLSDLAKQDLIEFLNVVYDVYSTKNASGLKSFFKDKLVPDLNIDPDAIYNRISSVISQATSSLKEEADGQVVELITSLINMIKGIFDLDVFYNDKFTAFLDYGNFESNPYETFLMAIGTLFTSAETFTSSIAGFDIVGMLRSMRDMLVSIKDMFVAISGIALKYVQGVWELGQSAVRGDVQALYEKLLLAGYMRHNLPCRTDDGELSSEYENGQAEFQYKLTGTGLTGFDYDDIARPSTVVGQSASYDKGAGESRFQVLKKTIDALKAGNGTDKMFKGAELEYIRAGTKSEIANQIICFLDIYFMRLLLDIPSVFTDTDVAHLASVASVAAWVVYILYILVEPFLDTVILVNGGSIGLVKSDCWLTASGIDNLIAALSKVTMSEELRNTITGFSSKYPKKNSFESVTDSNYQTHMLILLLLFVGKADILTRFQTIVDLEASVYYEQQGKSFAMEKAYTAVEITSDAKFAQLFDMGSSSGGAFIPKTTIKQTVGY